jgi:hypothetical protein
MGDNRDAHPALRFSSSVGGLSALGRQISFFALIFLGMINIGKETTTGDLSDQLGERQLSGPVLST